MKIKDLDLILSCMLCNFTPRFDSPSVCPSVRLSVSFDLFYILLSRALPSAILLGYGFVTTLLSFVELWLQK